MKSIVIIYFCVLWLSFVSNGVGANALINILKNNAGKYGYVSGIFTPSKDGFLGKNFFGHMYKGELVPTNKTVAMKFNDKCGPKEYEMYKYLGAINNPNVQAYGIPTIYHHGTWGDYFIMAMTLLDREFYGSNRNENFNKMDLLILLREYVRITKYIHGCGVFHKRVTLMEIWFRKHQGFIYDFNWAESLVNGKREDRLLTARRGWKVFFHDMYHFIKYPFERWSWLGLRYRNEADRKRMQNESSFVYSLMEDSDEPHKYSGLKKVFGEFAKYAFFKKNTSPTTPFYDQLYQVIVEEIEEYKKQQERPAILLLFPVVPQKTLSVETNEKKFRGTNRKGTSSSTPLLSDYQDEKDTIPTEDIILPISISKIPNPFEWENLDKNNKQ